MDLSDILQGVAVGVSIVVAGFYLLRVAIAIETWGEEVIDELRSIDRRLSELGDKLDRD